MGNEKIIDIKKITPEKIDEVYEYIKQFPLDYPDYNVWLKKCKKELKKGLKLGFYIIIDDKITGNVIFQTHKENPSIIEINNFRISPDYYGKGLGSRLYKKVENYAKKMGFLGIQVDTHVENIELIKFFEKIGFRIENKKPIYSPNQIEAILLKKL